MTELRIDDKQRERFDAQGFLIVDRLIEAQAVPPLHDAFERLFRGEFETGIAPDEVNWCEGTGDPTLTRQICNGWKANREIAAIVLSEPLGRAIAALANWDSVRIMIDNVIWKPPHTRPLGFHQDNAYLDWLEPSELLTCWIALDDTCSKAGTVEMVKGSHRWRISPPSGEFHGPEKYREPMEQAARIGGQQVEVVPIEVKAGGGSFHHGRTWHGSGRNSSTKQHRRALVLHAIAGTTQFRPVGFNQGIGPIYSRYKSPDTKQLPEDAFPIIWSKDGYRSPQIAEFTGAA